MPSLPRQSGVRGIPAANVLLVEDDFDSAEALLLLLEQSGYAVEVALTPQEAFGILDDGFSPSYAVIDLGLPDIDGWQFAAALRAKPELEDCRLIAVTGYEIEDFADRSRAAGFYASLIKPILLEQLLAAFGVESGQASHA